MKDYRHVLRNQIVAGFIVLLTAAAMTIGLGILFGVGLGIGLRLVR
jgi:NADH:ubiquinone oxidoreductase subunit K